ncbi:hypothetical protein J1N35_011974 [Gossypium stocksii]|uniref:RNase H type-1 domain-containing protein n=1 Tax=Gossypium stocksii TaxID=47602 RepID=A0A9D3W3D7_9ROSI|nr:hypothetical protein J1N35_011974 [Gossypium stocksii]
MRDYCGELVVNIWNDPWIPGPGNGDSLTVIKKLNSKMVDRSILNPISQNIRFLERYFDKVTYQFVPRDANKATHALAMDGRHRQTPCYWVEEAHFSVAVLVEMDRSAWFH